MCNTETIKSIEEGDALVLKRWQLILGIVLMILALVGNIAVASSWKTTTDMTLENHGQRIKVIENKVDHNSDVYKEIKLNLKTLLEAQGLDYKTIED